MTKEGHEKHLAEKEADRLILQFDGVRPALIDSVLVCFQHIDKISELESDLKKAKKEKIKLQKQLNNRGNGKSYII